MEPPHTHIHFLAKGSPTFAQRVLKKIKVLVSLIEQLYVCFTCNITVKIFFNRIDCSIGVFRLLSVCSIRVVDQNFVYK